MEIARLITVHPALVHFTIGAIPIMVLAYAVARWRRSRTWTFAGDLALFVTVVITLLTAAFGMVSFLEIDWPSGLTLWRWLHLGLGVTTTVLLLVLAVYRMQARRREEHNGAGTAVASGAIALVVLATGWVGGEVLVFWSGIGVQAAGNGALSPPIFATDRGKPKNLEQAMARMRAHWAAIETKVAMMVVEAPTTEKFDEVAEHARALEITGMWLSDFDVHETHETPSTAGPQVTRLGAKSKSSRPPARLQFAKQDLEWMRASGLEMTEWELAGNEMTFNEQVAAMSDALLVRSRSLGDAARSRDIRAVTDEAGKLTYLCAGCHEQLRWQR